MYTPERTYFLDEAKLRASERTEFGIPSLKKYPMPDRAHVKAAIRMFNHVDSAHEKELAAAIKRKMKEYNISPDTVGENNRLSKYVHEDTDTLTQEYQLWYLDEAKTVDQQTFLQKLKMYLIDKPRDVVAGWLRKLQGTMDKIKQDYNAVPANQRSLWMKIKNMLATAIEWVSRHLHNLVTRGDKIETKPPVESIDGTINKVKQDLNDMVQRENERQKKIREESAKLDQMFADLFAMMDKPEAKNEGANMKYDLSNLSSIHESKFMDDYKDYLGKYHSGKEKPDIHSVLGTTSGAVAGGLAGHSLIGHSGAFGTAVGKNAARYIKKNPKSTNKVVGGILGGTLSGAAAGGLAGGPIGAAAGAFAGMAGGNYLGQKYHEFTKKETDKKKKK